MALELSKGQSIDLEKDGLINSIKIGLKWGGTVAKKKTATSDTYENGKKKGFFARLFDSRQEAVQQQSFTPQRTVDVDSSIIMLDANGNIFDTVYYGKLTSNCGNIRHAGDDTTGRNQRGKEDNEEIIINLSKIPASVAKLVVVANVFGGASRGQDFGHLGGSYIRLINMDKNQEDVRYNLADNYDGLRGLVVADIYRYKGHWKIRAVGEGIKSDQLSDLKRIAKQRA